MSYKDNYWSDVTTIKDISSITYYKYNNKDYFFFGEKIGNTVCNYTCDNDINIYGKNCTNFDTMFYQWIIYNNNFGVKTLINLDLSISSIKTLTPNILVYDINHDNIFNLYDVQQSIN